MKESRRSQLEIKIDILKAARTIHKPTRIMYAVNLSWTVLQTHLAELLSTEHLSARSTDQRISPVLYYITNKGREALSRYKQLLEILI